MAYKFNPFTGTLDETGAGGSSSTPPAGAADTEVIFNNAGTLDGSADLTWDDIGKVLGVGGDINLHDGGTYSTTLQTVTATANRTISFPDATGTVALVAGASGQVQYNSGGALAGDSSFNYDDTNGSLTLGGKTVTADEPVLDLSQTWNSAGVTFTGLKLNVTNTASASDSNLLDLQVGGTSRFKVAANAIISITEGNLAGRTAINLPNYSHVAINNGRLWFQDDIGTIRQYFEQGLELWNLGFIGICPSMPVNTVADVRLYRDAANTFAQRNGTNAQTYSLYNTYTDASNYERTSITRDSSGLVIDAQKAGTGADPTNLLDLQIGGTSRFRVERGNQRVLANGYYIDTTIGYYLADGVNGTLNASGFKGLPGASFSWVNSSNANSGTIDLALVRDSAGVVKVTDGSTGTGYIKQAPVAVSALPSAATVGAGTRGFVNDANATTFASVVAGGGANVVPVYSDGADWRIG